MNPESSSAATMSIFYQVRNYIFTGIIFLPLTLPIQAQEGATMALESFEAGNYLDAMDRYGRLVNSRNAHPDYFVKLGQCYLRTNVDPLQALDHLLEAENKGDFPSEAYIDIAEAYTHHLQYDMALDYLNKYESEAKPKKKDLDNLYHLKANCIAAQDLLLVPAKVTFQNLGPGINSPYPDYLPFVAADEKVLLFSSRRKSRPGSKTEFDGYYASDIFVVTRAGTDWDKLSPVGDRINTEYDEQAVGLSASGDSLFYYVDHVDKYGDIFMSTKQMGGYGDGIPLDKAINSGFMESSVTVSKDGSTMIFSSNRKGGVDGIDLWMMRKSPLGAWSEPQNLGPEINTLWDEDFPTLSADGLTLYFSSNGHPGMGGFDLFFSSWDAQNGLWTKPQNLGYPINTPGNEKNISFIKNGKEAYIASLRPDGLGDLDLYKIVYDKDLVDDPALFLLNIVSSENEDLKDKIEIQIKDEYDELIGQYYPNSLTNRYLIALYPGKYFLSLDASGHKPYNEVLVVNPSHTRQEQNVKMIKLQK